MLIARVRLLESTLPSVVVGTVICLIAVGTLLQGTLPRAFLWPWLAAQATLITARVASVALWRRRPVSEDDVDGRLYVAIAHGTLSASLWGLLGYVGVVSPDPLANLVVIMMMTGLVAGATAVVSHLPQVYLPYTFAVMLPAALHLLLAQGPGEQRWLGALMLWYVLFSLIAARSAGKAVRESIAFRFQNAELVDGLREAHGGAEEERRRAEAALERERRANLSKSRFLAAASHDLRQPLHSLRLHVATLQSQTRGTRHEATAMMMGNSVHALDELFDAILDISKLDAGTLDASPVDAPLGSLLERLAADYAPLAADRGLALRIEPVEVSVHTDPLLLERLLRNLLTNAVRYTESGEVRIDVVDASDGHVGVRVVDTGPGIPARDRTRVFEEFVQLENPERDRSQGIGLGLSIVRRIADLLGLPLELGETPGGGTTVTVTVPRGRIAAPRARTFAEASSPSPPSGERRPLMVLVIDDEEAVRVAMEDFLEENDCIALPVDSGDEALETLAETGCVPDAILCDYRLRADERGTDAVRRVRERCGADIPAILVTGDIAVDGLRDIRDSGLEVLHKPCDPATLLDILETVREGSHGGDTSRVARAADVAIS